MQTKGLAISMLFILSATVAMAQNDKHKMTDTQKAQAAKADVFIVNSKKKIKDSLTTNRDTSATISKKKSGVKPNKKSS